MHPETIEQPYIHISGNSSYLLQGESVSLTVERIDNAGNGNITSGDLALQLWACDEPYNRETLSGWKIAEAPFGTLQPNHFVAPVNQQVQANLPGTGDYAIVLAVAEWDGGGYNRIHAFHNFPGLNTFLHPRLAGTVGYRCLDTGRVVVEVGRIHNPRDANNLSGTLSLELWALPGPYAGGAFAGHGLTAVTLGSLAGGESWCDCAYELRINPPPDGTHNLALMLREWTGNGYVTRDHAGFPDQVTFPLDTASPRTSASVNMDAPPVPSAHLTRAPEPAPGAAGTVHAEGTADTSGSTAAQAIGQTRAAPEDDNGSLRPGTGNQGGPIRRVLGKLRHWFGF